MKAHKKHQPPKPQETKTNQLPPEVLSLLPQLLEKRLGRHLDLLEETNTTVKTDLLKVRSNINQLIGSASSFEPKLLDMLITHEPFQEPQDEDIMKKEKLKAPVPSLTIGDSKDAKENNSFLQGDSFQSLSPIEKTKNFKDFSPWFSPNSKTGTRVELHTPGIFYFDCEYLM